MTTAENRGCFVWFDLMTTEPQAAVDFYTGLIGWQTQSWEGGETPYTMWTNGERPLGGVMELPEEIKRAGVKPHWLAYVSVPDVDGAAASSSQLGGKVLHPPTDIPTVGRFALIADPQGASIAIFTPASEMPGAGAPPAAGDFSWHELATSDQDAAFDFYVELFGWQKLQAMDMGPAGIYQLFGRDEVPLGGIFTKPPAMDTPAMWLYYVKVEDLDATVKQVEELGGKVINGPMEVPEGDRIAQCFDAQGAIFALHSSA